MILKLRPCSNAANRFPPVNQVGVSNCAMAPETIPDTMDVEMEEVVVDPQAQQQKFQAAKAAARWLSLGDEVTKYYGSKWNQKVN